MIRESFIFLERFGKNSEQRLWNNGIHGWDEFLDAKSLPRISKARKPYYDRQIIKARKALYSFDSAHFNNLLANGDTWRLYNFFKDDVCFLDIETSGYYSSITVVGMYDGYETKTLVRNQNLDKHMLKKAFGDCKLIVTFNGSSFDLPVIRRYFGNDSVPDVPHIDLRHVCSKIGLIGGLKRIEKEVGIARDDEVSNVSGEDAVYLWQQYKATGDRKYLELLVKYNEEDIVNLQPLAEMVVDQLWKQIKPPKL